jgi:fumarate hydratase class II
VINFPVSGIRLPRRFLRAIGLIKKAAAQTNRELGLLDAPLAEAIARAAQEVADGAWDAHFPLDVFQTGSGTSTNMNANEVIAHRAAEILGGARGAVHPNDHVNLGQSSNDVIPTRCDGAGERNTPPEFGESSDGHLIFELTPSRLGLLGYAGQMDKSLRRLARPGDSFRSADRDGTGINT